LLWRSESTDFQVLLMRQILPYRMPFPVVILCILFLLLTCYFNLFCVVIVSQRLWKGYSFVQIMCFIISTTMCMPVMKFFRQSLLQVLVAWYVSNLNWIANMCAK
jgi:hypothetical protein